MISDLFNDIPKLIPGGSHMYAISCKASYVWHFYGKYLKYEAAKQTLNKMSKRLIIKSKLDLEAYLMFLLVLVNYAVPPPLLLNFRSAYLFHSYYLGRCSPIDSRHRRQ